MTKASGGRLLTVWLALSGITAVSWWLGAKHNQSVLTRNKTITFAVLLIAAVKMRLIIREFMEVRRAPALLCRLTDGGIVLLFVVLFGLYALGIGYRS